jgi:hypothetical protein
MKTDETELAELKARLDALERAAKPAPPFKSDYVAPSPYRHLDRLAMPASAMRAMVRAVPDHLVRAIAADRYSTSPVSCVAPPEGTTGKAVNTTGWRDTGPLEPPAGVALADRLMDVQDAKDRAELIAGEAGRRVKR